MAVLCCSCIEPFEPVIKEAGKTLVINGFISDQPGEHEVTISRTTPYNSPGFSPLQGCVVRVQDGDGNMILYHEDSPGHYKASIEEDFLGLNRVYSLDVYTPEGDEYRSSYDTMLACPDIDTLFWELEDKGTPDPDFTYHGIRFFSGFSGPESGARNFRWILEETWEYKAAHLTSHLWYGGPEVPVIVDTFLFCWLTTPLPGIYLGSTRNLTLNTITRNTLSYVSNETPRLKIKYSLLVKKHSLTNEAYAYWDRLKSQLEGSGGLYETQPASAYGNLSNVNDPEEKVLGCFYATQQKEKRVSVKAVEDYDFLVHGFQCELDTIQSLGELGTHFPYYLYTLNPMYTGPPYLAGPDYCFNCVYLGGSNKKPSFW